MFQRWCIGIAALLGVLSLAVSCFGEQDVIRGYFCVNFSSGKCDSELACKMRKSESGIQSIEYHEDGMIVKAVVIVNCGVEIVWYDYKIDGDRLILQYQWDKSMTALCDCAYELKYDIMFFDGRRFEDVKLEAKRVHLQS